MRYHRTEVSDSVAKAGGMTIHQRHTSVMDGRAQPQQEPTSGDNADLDLLAVAAFARGGARLASRARSSRAMIAVSSRVGREGAAAPEPTRNVVTLVMSRGG